MKKILLTLMLLASISCSHTKDTHKETAALFAMFDMHCVQQEIEVLKLDNGYYVAVCESRNKSQLYRAEPTRELVRVP